MAIADHSQTAQRHRQTDRLTDTVNMPIVDRG